MRAEAAAALRRALARLPAGHPAREQLEVTLLAVSYTWAPAREVASAIVELHEPDRSARGLLPAATLATLAMDEVMYLRSASAAIDLAERALEAGPPPSHITPGRDWRSVSSRSRSVSTRPGAGCGRDPRRGPGARCCAYGCDRPGASSVHRRTPRGLISAEADAHAAIELAADLVGSEFVVVVAAPEAVLAWA